MRGRGLLRRRGWSVGPKLVFDLMAASVPEIKDCNRGRYTATPASVDYSENSVYSAGAIQVNLWFW
jgi:hypothetical protein